MKKPTRCKELARLPIRKNTPLLKRAALNKVYEEKNSGPHDANH